MRKFCLNAQLDGRKKSKERRKEMKEKISFNIIEDDVKFRWKDHLKLGKLDEAKQQRRFGGRIL